MLLSDDGPLMSVCMFAEEEGGWKVKEDDYRCSQKASASFTSTLT